VAIFHDEIRHEKASGFLRFGDYGSKELWEHVKSDVRRHEQKSGVFLLLDETISEKTYTDENSVNY
jgi:hypothetical protein